MIRQLLVNYTTVQDQPKTKCQRSVDIRMTDIYLSCFAAFTGGDIFWEVRAMAHVIKVNRATKDTKKRHAWKVCYRDSDRVERARTFTKMAEAEKFASTIETDHPALRLRRCD